MAAMFGIHSLHRHDCISPGMVRLETPLEFFDTPVGTWTKSTCIGEINPEHTHGILYKLVDGQFVPFEFASGTSPANGVSVSAEFLAEVATYFTDNRLQDVFALEIGDFKDRGTGLVTGEFEVQWGDLEAFTVVLPASRLYSEDTTFIPTGWHVDASHQANAAPGSSLSDGKTTYAKRTTPVNTHKVFVGSLEPVTGPNLRAKLVETGFIKD